MPRDDEQMEAERRIAELTAQTVVARLLDAATDKETAAKVMEVWSGEIDRTIGRGLRRAMWYVMVALVGIGAAKFGLLDKLFGFFKP